MTIDLGEIAMRAAAATAGPWTWDARRVPTLSGRAGDSDTYAYDIEVVEAHHDGECGCRSACVLELDVLPANADFIAHARDDVPALVDVIERLANLLYEMEHDESLPMHFQADICQARGEILDDWRE